MNPPQHVCNYALLRYLPYPETGEFVNVGVVAHCADLRWFGHAGIEHDDQRVTLFFPAVVNAVYFKQRNAFFNELERVRALISATADRGLAGRIFQELVKPRESVFRFGEMRTVMADNPETLLPQLCDEYVKPKQAAAPLVSA